MTRKYDPEKLTACAHMARITYQHITDPNERDELTGEYIANYLGLEVTPKKPAPGTWWVHELKGTLYFRIADAPDGQDAWSFPLDGETPVKSYRTPWYRLKKAAFYQVPELPKNKETQ